MTMRVQRKNGNIWKSSKEENIPETQEFQPGDVVALTQAALRMGHISKMTPRILYQEGWENKFLVMRTFETEEDGPCVALWPCCHVPESEPGANDGNEGMVDRRTNRYRCNGHPIGYFQKIDLVRIMKKGDRSASINFPWIGQIFGVDYKDDSANPELWVNLFGAKGGVTGFLAKFVKNLAEANGWM